MLFLWCTWYFWGNEEGLTITVTLIRSLCWKPLLFLNYRRVQKWLTRWINVSHSTSIYGCRTPIAWHPFWWSPKSLDVSARDIFLWVTLKASCVTVAWCFYGGIEKQDPRNNRRNFLFKYYFKPWISCMFY